MDRIQLSLTQESNNEFARLRHANIVLEDPKLDDLIHAFASLLISLTYLPEVVEAGFREYIAEYSDTDEDY